jgi:hypothetical protein
LKEKNIAPCLGDLALIKGLDRIGIEIPRDFFLGSGRASTVPREADKEDKENEKNRAGQDG